MSWKKPNKDPLVSEVAFHLNNAMSEGLSISCIERKTGLCKNTIKNVLMKKSKQPHPTTLRFLLRCVDMELVVRPRGSNR